MLINLKEKVFNISTHAYLSYKEAVTNKKGSPTVEYVIIIGVGAAVASLLAMALSEGNSSGIVSTLSKKVEEVINKALTLK